MAGDVTITQTLVLPMSVFPFDQATKETTEMLVQRDHYLKTHTSFPDLLFYFLSKNFFYNVYCKLAGTEQKKTSNAAPNQFRAVIELYYNAYVRVSNFQFVPYKAMSQFANYASIEVFTVFTNNVTMRMGQYFNQAVNVAAKKKQKIKAIKDKQDSISMTQIRKDIKSEVIDPIKNLKGLLAVRWPKLDLRNSTHQNVWNELSFIWSSYKKTDTFFKDSLYYDVKADAKKHLKAFLRICQYLERSGAKGVQSIPLRTNWIPCHVQFDNAIIGSHFLTHAQRKMYGKNEYWTGLYDKENGPLKWIVGKGFKGTYTTDGVTGCFTYQKRVPKVYGEDALSIPPKISAEAKRKAQDENEDENNIQEEEYTIQLPLPLPVSDTSEMDVDSKMDTPAKQPTYLSPVDRASSKHTPQELANVMFPYANHLPKDELAKFDGNVVAGDGGQRDIWTFVHQKSGSAKGEQLTMTYTLQQRNQELKLSHYNSIRKKVKTKAVTDAEGQLTKTPHTAILISSFWKYLRNRADVYDVLSEFYTNTQTIHPQSSHPLAVRKRAEVQTAAAAALSSPSSSVSITSGNASTLPTSTTPTTFPLHRKLRLSAYINQKQSDQRLGHALRTKFGEDMVLMLGNWVSGKRKHHQPIRGKKWRSVFKSLGFKVILIDEYLTSQVCPHCLKRSLKNFYPVYNPRLRRMVPRPRKMKMGKKMRQAPDHERHVREYRKRNKWKSKMPSDDILASKKKILCHGLLKCTNRENCFAVTKKGEVRDRYWSRDISACLCMIQKYESLVSDDGVIPEIFWRKDADASSPSNKCPALSSRSRQCAIKRRCTRSPQ